MGKRLQESPMKRLIPALDFLGALFFLSGKITTSLKLRVGFF
jgi:hypothetical protein